MKRITTMKSLLMAASLLLMGTAAYGQTTLSRSVIASGGTTMAGANIRVNGTIGQAVIGPATSASIVAWQGFWYTAAQQAPLSVDAASTGAGDASAAALNIYPNPVADRATLRVRVPRSGHLTIKLYDALGQEALTLFDANHERGELTVDFSARDLAAGNYMAVLTAGGTRVVTPVVVVQ